MTHWNLAISDEMDLHVRQFLEQGVDGGEDLAAFVEQAVRAEILRRAVRQMQEENADLSEDEAQSLADEAVAWARANPA